MRINIFLILTSLIFNFSSAAQTSTIKGHLTNYKLRKNATIHVILNKNQSNSVAATDSSGNYKPINKTAATLTTTVDSFGDFRFSDLTEGWAELTFYTIGYPDYYNIYTLILNKNEVINLEVDYPKNSKRKTSKTCPLCRKKNQTIPVIFGLLNDVTLRKIKQKKVLLEGSTPRPYSPHWYCKRDKIHY